MIEKPVFNGVLKIIGAQNQLPITFFFKFCVQIQDIKG